MVDRSSLAEARRLVGLAWPALYGLPYWRLVQRLEQRWEMWNVLPYTMRRALGLIQASPPAGPADGPIQDFEESAAVRRIAPT